MSLARRGIFGMLAALPFMPKAAAASLPAAREVRMELSVTSPDFTEFREAVARNLQASRAPLDHSAVNAVFREYIESQTALGGDIQRDGYEAAPFGWDALENVR